jgi:hypothetical protein
MKPLLLCLLLLVFLGSVIAHAAPDAASQNTFKTIAELQQSGKFAEAEKAAQSLVTTLTQTNGAEN